MKTRQILGGLLLALLTLSASSFAVDYYTLTDLKRVNIDLFETQDLSIETLSCGRAPVQGRTWHLSPNPSPGVPSPGVVRRNYGEDAVLQWDDPGSLNNKLYWDKSTPGETTCVVKRVRSK